MTGEFRVCIVGAGAGGLSMARALKRHGIAYDHFESHDGAGGIWDQANGKGPMYDSARMISSRTRSGFKGFPMPRDYPDYPDHRQILAYLNAFADAYGLRDRIRFATTVESARKEGDRWKVKTSDGTTGEYDAVVAATGLAWHPRMPDYPGTFSGEMIHSSRYRSPDAFAGRKVLVIGAGNSGVDIASEVSRVAGKAMLSMRRGYHFIPKYLFGLPADVFALTGSLLPMRVQQWVLAGVLRLLNGDVTRHGLRKPDHLPFSSHPIVNSTALKAMAKGELVPKVDVAHFDGSEVVFTDGSRETVDAIICATGYIHKVPFAEPGLLENGGEESNLFMRTFSRADPTFCPTGFVEINGAAFPVYDEFSDIAALYFAEKAKGSEKAREFEEIVRSGRHDVSGQVDYVESPRHHVYANVLETARQVKALKRALGWPGLGRAELKPASAGG